MVRHVCNLSIAELKIDQDAPWLLHGELRHLSQKILKKEYIIVYISTKLPSKWVYEET